MAKKIDAQSRGDVLIVAACLMAVPLDNDEKLELARTHQLALEYGWLPSDEDTAAEFCRDEGLDLSLPIEGWED
jgi:hypothetical protein